jgi:hypothetical protein
MFAIRKTSFDCLSGKLAEIALCEPTVEICAWLLPIPIDRANRVIEQPYP